MRLRLVIPLLLGSSTALGQLISNTDIPVFVCQHCNDTYGGGNSVSIGRGTAAGQPKSYCEVYNCTPKKTPAEVEADKIINEYNKLSKLPDSPANLRAWLDLARRTDKSIAAAFYGGQVWYKYALMAWNLGQADDAFALFQTLAVQCPHNQPTDVCEDSMHNAATIQEKIGTDFYNQGRYEEAVQAYKKAIAVDGRNPEPQCDLFAAYNELHDWNGAYNAAQNCMNLSGGQGAMGARGVNCFHFAWEQMHFWAAQDVLMANVGKVPSIPTDYQQSLMPHLWAAVRFDGEVEDPSRAGRRGLLAQVLHEVGADSQAETEADITMLEDPGDPTFAQLVLDSIHDKDLPHDPDCQVSSESNCLVGHWPNKCHVIVTDNNDPKNGVLWGCRP